MVRSYNTFQFSPSSGLNNVRVKNKCTSGRTDGRTNAWMNEWMNEWTNEWMNEWFNDWLNEWMNEWVNVSTRNETVRITLVYHLSTFLASWDTVSPSSLSLVFVSPVVQVVLDPFSARESVLAGWESSIWLWESESPAVLTSLTGITRDILETNCRQLSNADCGPFLLNLMRNLLVSCWENKGGK